ncbi:hypothetical protein DHEL01_v200097 [Diaporthe helianthi]|uniref:Nephrocystin 3-like N-terminal domain-containing protein n=1 Tax=Diaporthe helianthi TaxID=158607 RepID=A0A2P5IG90_DIAHE|nr:hypothetical protein DHEL01_v200097 [Diaporthe helianthi]
MSVVAAHERHLIDEQSIPTSQLEARHETVEMADPLSVAASVAGLLGLAEQGVSAAIKMNAWIQDMRHESVQRRRFCDRFTLIQKNLESLCTRIKRIEAQFGPGTISKSNDGVIYGIKLSGGDRLFAISQDIYKTGTEFENLRQKLKFLIAETESIVEPKHKEWVRRAKWTWKKQDLVKDQTEIIRLIAGFREMVSDGDAEVNYDIYFKVGHIEEEVGHLRQVKDDDRTIEILNWICQPALSLREPPNPAQGVVLNPSSNRFMAHNETYKQWLTDGSWQLNCYGKPGSGKSVLAEAIAADLRQQLEPQGTPVLSIFFRSEQASRQTLDVVLCNLLRQLLTSRDSTGICEIPEDIKKLWSKSRSIARRSLSAEQAREHIHDQLSRFPTKFIIVDAVDEAEGCMDSIADEIKELRSLGFCILTTDRRDPRVNYDAAYCHKCGTGPLELAWLCRICDGHFGEGKVWLCRECYMVKNERCSDTSHAMAPPRKVNVEISATHEDIQLLVTRFLSDSFSAGDIGDDDDMFSGNIPLLRALKKELGSEFWDSLPSKVSGAAEGNFLVARLFLDRLRLQRNQAGILSLIAELDSGKLKSFEEQYDAMLSLCLERNDRYGVQVARDYMSIVASAYEVLTFEQVSHATAIRPKDRGLSDFSGRICSKATVRRDTQGLITAQHTGSANTFPVSFFHRSLAAYMEENRSKWFPDAEQSVSEACMSYMRLDVFSRPFNSRDELEKAIQEHPFASYAACYWGFHARSIQGTAENNLRVLEFLNDQERLECVMQISWHTRSFEGAHWDVPAGITPLHFCAFYGLETLCQAIVTFNPGELSIGEDSYNQTPLIYACRRRHTGVARLLLDAGADPNRSTKKGKTPLIEATETSYLGMIDLLLSREDIDVNFRAPGRQSKTALVIATENGYVDVVEKLLARADIDINKPDGAGCTALSRAVQHAHIDIVQLLLNCSATDLTLTDHLGHRSALDWTAEEIVVNSGVSTEELDSVADILLADRRSPKPSNEAVGVAISQGRIGLLETFVKRNRLELLYVDEHGRNLLHLAASMGNLSVVRLMLEQFSRSQSFRIDSCDNHGSSALHLTCRYLSSEAQVETIAFLLDQGADPSLKDGEGLSSMTRAKHASPELWISYVRAVFEAKGVAIDATLKNLKPTLLSALHTESIAVVETQLNSSPGPLDPETDVYTGETLLWRVIEQENPRNVSLLKLLLPRSSHFLSARCNHGRTCAHLAVLRSCSDSLELLIDAGIDINTRDKWGMTALQLAQSLYRYEMCVHLISKGAELPPNHEIRPALLHAAVMSGNAEPVGRLLAAGVDTRHRDEKSGMTALQTAERLLEDSERDVKDELIRQWDHAVLESVSVFEAEAAKAPEVIRRKEVRDLVRNAQGPDSRGQWRVGRRLGSHEGLEKALVALKEMDSDRILTPADLLPPEAEVGADIARHGGNVGQIELSSEASSTALLMKPALAHPGMDKRTIGLLLAVIIGWLMATTTQLMLR